TCKSRGHDVTAKYCRNCGGVLPDKQNGRLVASLLILIGYSVIAIPTGILTSQMTDELRTQRKARVCPTCKSRGHDVTAKYCRNCGGVLPDKQK
ncbi:zinc ribbon domain-containing protein, partial [Atlantibacter hermannii]